MAAANLNEMVDWARSYLTGDDMLERLDMADDSIAVAVFCIAIVTDILGIFVVVVAVVVVAAAAASFIVLKEGKVNIVADG